MSQMIPEFPGLSITAPQGFYLLGTHELVKKGDKFTCDWGAKWDNSGNWCSNNPTQAKGDGWAYARPIPAPVADRQLSDFYVLPADHALRDGIDWVWIPWDRRWVLTNGLAGITVGSFSSGFAVCEKYNEPIEGYVWLGAEAVLCKHTDEVMYKGNDKWEDVLGLDGCELCAHIDEYPYARRRIPAPAIADKRGPRPTPPEGYALVEGHMADAVKGDKFHTATGWQDSTSHLDTPPTHCPNIWYCRKVEVPDPRGPAPELPVGYYMLAPDVPVERGDKYMDKYTNKWTLSGHHRHRSKEQGEELYYCRPIKQEVSVVEDLEATMPTPEPTKVIKSITPSYIWTKGEVFDAVYEGKRWLVTAGSGEFPDEESFVLCGPHIDGTPEVGRCVDIEEGVEYWHCFFELPVFETKDVVRHEYVHHNAPTRTMWAEEKDKPSGLLWKATGRTETMKVRTK